MPYAMPFEGPFEEPFANAGFGTPHPRAEEAGGVTPSVTLRTAPRKGIARGFAKDTAKRCCEQYIQ